MVELDDSFDGDRVQAAVKLIGRTGAGGFELRYSDPAEDEADGPVVWMAIANYGDRHEVDAATDPTRAVLRLCERLIDGGQCRHCRRGTAFDPGFEGAFLTDQMCWYQYDPERKLYRRGCE